MCAHVHACLHARHPPSLSCSASGDCSLPSWVQLARGEAVGARCGVGGCPLPSSWRAQPPDEGEDSLALGHRVTWVTVLRGCGGGCCRVCRFPDEGEKSVVCHGVCRPGAPRGPVPCLRPSCTRVLSLSRPLVLLFLFIGDCDSVALTSPLCGPVLPDHVGIWARFTRSCHRDLPWVWPKVTWPLRPPPWVQEAGCSASMGLWSRTNARPRLPRRCPTGSAWRGWHSRYWWPRGPGCLTSGST